MKFLCFLLMLWLPGKWCAAQNTDSIEIIAQFTGNVTSLPGQIRLTQYKLPKPATADLQVNIYRSFRHKMLLTEPTLLTLSLPNATYNFIAGPAERTYRIEITMQGTEVQKVNVDGSVENNAYNMFTKMTEPFLQQLFGYLKNPASNSYMANNTNMHLANMRHIASAYRGTYTADVLAASLLFDSITTEVSPAYFKSRMLKVKTLNEPSFYNTTHAADLLSIYSICFLDTSVATGFAFYDTIFETITSAEARSRMHMLLFQLYFYKQREKELGIYADWANAHPGLVTNEYIKKQLAALAKVMPGKKVPEISDADFEGNTVSLTATALANNKTILAIWSPNCEHCAEEIPALKGIWDKYHPAGLQIYSVAIDCSKEDWKQFSAKHNISWINTYHPTLPNNDPLDEYKISYTPTYVIIDNQANIISRFAHFEHLEELIK
ncbi:MAG TPA: TlpA disulfide reductase family protein [Chitinophagales bacterium]|nr:TlpA disulfide reductase family protein [Chitinophagales bacterium]